MKTVCLLVQNHYEIDIRVRRKAEALLAAGYGVDVLALASSYSKSPTYVLNGVNVHTMSLGKKRGSLGRYAFEYLAFFLWCAFKLVGLMEKRRYSVVDVNTLPDFLIFAAVYPKLRGAKLVFDMHEITPEFYISKYGIKESSWLIRVLRWVEKASFNFADHVMTINQPIQNLLESRGLPAVKTTVIMNAADEALFASVGNASVEPETEERRNEFIMMYHGTLTPLYGLDIAIEAFGRVHAHMPGAKFWILGNGTEKATLERLARERGVGEKVKFIGNVLPQEVPQWLKRCDVGVLATRSDIFLDYSFSNKLSEYILMDRCVISSRLKAIRHYFSEDAFVFFAPNDFDDLGRKMLQAFRDPRLRQRLAEKAKQEYAPICWQVMKKRYLLLMDNLVGIRRVSEEAAAQAASALLTR